MLKIVALVLLFGLPLAGYVNYLRNEPLDQELQERLYADLSDEDLETTLAAYEAELKSFQELGKEPTTTRHSDPSRYGHYDQKVAAFERFQQTNTDWKRSRGRAMEHRSTVEALRHEKSVRERGLHIEWKRIRRRVLTF